MPRRGPVGRERAQAVGPLRLDVGALEQELGGPRGRGGDDERGDAEHEGDASPVDRPIRERGHSVEAVALGRVELQVVGLRVVGRRLVRAHRRGLAGRYCDG